MPSVSIIIPIYNASKYIRKCFNSILAQTLLDWEAILVNDGSTDNSGAICDEYSAIDNRFKVIHQSNGGVSIARQTGLNNATGEYIIHCDPDDWTEHNMLEELVSCAVNNKADMVICDFYCNNKEEEKYISQGLGEELCAKDIQAKIINQQIHGSLCNKLINKKCLKNITFYPDNISLGEDDLFNIKVLNNDIKVVYLPKAFYHYNIDNPTSLCHKIDPKIIHSRMYIINELQKMFQPNSFNNFYEMKKNVITSIFTSKQFHLLQETYPEIHLEIAKRGNSFNPLLPLGYFLSMAIKGSPRTAYFLYKVNLNLISFISRIRKHFKSVCGNHA